MKTAAVVIGSGFGDEGKGLATDFLAARLSASPDHRQVIVARFNGGAQAGHTVVTPDGKRHVFSHFSSGALSGAATFLSRHFVCNPLLFIPERKKLAALGACLDVHIDARAPVTSPYDMMINQIAEESRGQKRHGSCGLGFGETLERQENSAFPLRYADLNTPSKLAGILRGIRHDWVPARLQNLGVEKIPDDWQARLSSDDLQERFMSDISDFVQHTRGADPSYLERAGNGIVFEGAQGLLLDQDYGRKLGWFPHVTRSNTGLLNAVDVASEAGLDTLTTHYMTRAYSTRHGAGPLPYEMASPPSPLICDETNIKNPWQGHLRFAPLDLTRLAGAIAHDIESVKHSSLRIRQTIGVTCLDQMEKQTTIVLDNAVEKVDTASLAARIANTTRSTGLVESHGPTRDHVRIIH